jgi:FKBP-type peptidyl-prolyl cis-trans isomerase (trigger factor)
MLLTSLQSDVARPHLGRIELECRMGVADIRAHVMQVVKELAKDVEACQPKFQRRPVPGFRKGKAPLKRVQAHYIKDVRARALARLVDSIQEAVGEQVGKKYRILGSPKPEYDKDARLDELTTFEVRLAYDIDLMSDDLLAPKGLVNAPDTGG